MTTGHHHHGFDYADFLPRFKKGEFDNIILNTTTPALTGRYWPWITEAQVEAHIVPATTPATNLQEIASEAERAAELAAERVGQHIADADIAEQAKAVADM